MKVKDVKVCLDCDEVYEGEKHDACPGCGSCSGVDLKNWLMPLPTKRELENEIRNQARGADVDRIVLRAKHLIMPGADIEPLGVGA